MSDIDICDRVRDAQRLTDSRDIPQFVGFLSPLEAAAAEPLLKGVRHRFFGGFESAERTFLGIFPDWVDRQNEQSLFPITPITFRFKPEFPLSHRDFLGAVMALGVTRRSVGDILVKKGAAVLFAAAAPAKLILSEVTKVGSVGVLLGEGLPEDFHFEKDFEDGSATVQSLRLDSVVAQLSNSSRNKAAELISDGLVSVNSVARQKGTAVVREGDILSVRGHGKFLIESAADHSKKGRIILRWKKYI